MAEIISLQQKRMDSTAQTPPPELALINFELARAEDLMNCIVYLSASLKQMQRIQRDLQDLKRFQ